MYEKLRNVRKNKRIKARDLADILGLKTLAAYYKKENETVPLTIEEGIKICVKLETTLNEIFLPDDYLSETLDKPTIHETLNPQ